MLTENVVIANFAATPLLCKLFSEKTFALDRNGTCFKQSQKPICEENNRKKRKRQKRHERTLLN